MDSPWQIEWHASLPSTMDRAAQLAAEGAPAGTVVVADYQSQGRGTRGRVWSAPPGTCLMFSLILRPTVPTDQLEHLPAQVAELVAGTLYQQFGIRATVKAPNDILVSGRKLCGILCTSRVQGERVGWVICGIGLNSTMRHDQLPVPTATSLALESITVPSHDTLLNTMLTGLEPLLEPGLTGLPDLGSGCAARD